MQENEDRNERKKKKRKYLFCESMSAFIAFFLIKIKKKVLTAVIHTLNHVVDGINNEV